MTTRKLPDVLASAPILEALTRIDARIREHTELAGEQAPSVLTWRWCRAEIERGLEQASEVWVSTGAVVAACGWDEGTVAKWARAKLAGEKVPFDWRRMQVRKAGTGYAFNLSSVPIKPRAAS